MRRRSRWLLTLAIAVIVLGAAPIALSAIVRHYVDSTLALMGSYSGSVADVDVALVRGAHTLRDLVVPSAGLSSGRSTA